MDGREHHRVQLAQARRSPKHGQKWFSRRVLNRDPGEHHQVAACIGDGRHRLTCATVCFHSLIMPSRHSDYQLGNDFLNYSDMYVHVRW